MTATARRIQASAFAPILDWTKGAEVDLMYDVVEYMNDAIRKAEESKRKAEDEYLARKMAEYKASIGGKWPFEPLPQIPEWDTQAAWNRLSDAQREQAIKLKLTADDMDIRTFGILTKWIRE